eukprot:5204113-Pleurochrysis_carterae.AAC.2
MPFSDSCPFSRFSNCSFPFPCLFYCSPLALLSLPALPQSSLAREIEGAGGKHVGRERGSEGGVDRKK